MRGILVCPICIHVVGWLFRQVFLVGDSYRVVAKLDLDLWTSLGKLSLG